MTDDLLRASIATVGFHDPDGKTLRQCEAEAERLEQQGANMARYELRYTNDLVVIASSDTTSDMQQWGRRSDYKVHVIDTVTGAVVWQNAPSERYGDVAVCANRK